jgi:GNAT superfamily N-acetyltransferase
MGPLSIRTGTPDDAETLFAIHKESAMTAYVEIFPPDRYRFPDERMRAHWEGAVRDEEADVLVAERSGAAVGFATMSPGWLRNLFVLPAEWGRGAGGTLHDEAVVLLRGHGTAARLWVLEANERARRFYERRGWNDDGARSRSEFPPHPVELRYALDLGMSSAPRTHPKPPPTQGDELRG